MTNWLKPDELPKGFWGECYIAYKTHDQIEVQQYTTMVRRVELFPEWYFESEEYWTSFNSSDDYRVKVVEYPKITEGDFE